MNTPKTLRGDIAESRHPTTAYSWKWLSVPVLSRALMAWTMLFGTISHELFGYLANVIHDHEAFFDLQVGRAAQRSLSLTSSEL